MTHPYTRAIAACAVASIVALHTTAIADEIILVDAGAGWYYLDDGTFPGPEWTEPAFNDTEWPSGAAQLGYGDGDEATVVSYGPDPDNKYITTYFRHHFVVSADSPVTLATLKLLRDDGAIVYLDGNEIFRSNMPEGEVTHNTLALDALGGDEEDEFVSTAVDPMLLTPGGHVLAVEIHQAEPDSSDISFDLCLSSNDDIKLVAPDGGHSERFGISVAVDQSFAVVGASRANNGVGAAYFYQLIGGAWTYLNTVTPPDGGFADDFGISVSIDNGIAVVGAFQQFTDPVGAGYAYVYQFDGDDSFNQIGTKLTANGAQFGDWFGQSVAVSNQVGAWILVGAPGDNDFGASSGSAHVYTWGGSDWVHVTELHASDASSNDRFGLAVDICGDIAIIGSPLEDAAAFQGGAAYVFRHNGTAWAQEYKLLGVGTGEQDMAGSSVSISGRVAVMGAPQNDLAGTNAGAAFVFRRNDNGTPDNPGDDTWPQEATLTSTESQFIRMGQAVSVDGDTLLVGAIAYEAYTGAAYLYEYNGSSWFYEERLEAFDAAETTHFGNAVDTNDGTHIIGSSFAAPNNHGAAYVFGQPITPPDSDGDGLPDHWELYGVDADCDGLIDLDLPAMGANFLHKDLFVEIDAMTGLSFHATARANVIAAFAAVPNALVNNPDLQDGINLHLLYDETNLPLQVNWPLDIEGGNWCSGYDTMKAQRFGTAAERTNANWNAIRHARMRTHRYCIVAHTYGNTSSSGLAELPGNDMMMTMGSWTTPGGTINQQAGTFMHEFGHTLGLKHGGCDHIHQKPNYYSVMNYTWQFPASGYSSSWSLDYSRQTLPTLNEAHLNEVAGIGAPTGHFPGMIVPYGYGDTPALAYAIMAGGTPVDWNQNGVLESDVAVDLNYMFPPDDSASPNESLCGHTDWTTIQYAIGTTGDYADGAHESTTVGTEMTLEMYNNFNNIPPPTVCLADVNGDLAVDVTDLLIVLGSWGPCPKGCAGDINGDTEVDVEDLLLVLAAWGACP